MKTELYYMEQEVNAHCITAEAFPHGVEEMHQQLRTLWPEGGRRSFGIFYPDVYGRLVYHAAVECFDGECVSPNHKSFLIRKGGFLASTVAEGKSQRQMISQTFHHLMKDDRAHPFGYCLEVYLSGDVVRCMVPLKNFQP